LSYELFNAKLLSKAFKAFTNDGSDIVHFFISRPVMGRGDCESMEMTCVDFERMTITHSEIDDHLKQILQTADQDVLWKNERSNGNSVTVSLNRRVPQGGDNAECKGEAEFIKDEAEIFQHS
jgi:hypothetical protein